MKVALVGPELEENLALRYIHAAVTAAGHEARIYDFHAEDQLAHVASSIDAFAPDAVGLSMMFTARSREFVDLATRLRELGFAGHITAGGHFASFHAERLLDDCPALDSIVHGEGEEAMCELLDHLAAPSAVTGVTCRSSAGATVHTGFRTNLRDLDERVYPTRPDKFHRYLGMGIASLLAGRGCYANCNFCSINAWHRQSGGPRFRQRSVGAIAHEMAELYHCREVRIFNFQDDQFFLPTEKANLERLGALRDELDRYRVGKIALQVKARPDSVTRPVISLLKQMGLFRVFLGVETNAVVGLETLGRGIQRQQNHLALDILRDHAVHTCFNLLIFDPESELSALWENIEFLERQSYFPLNFCRVEVYAGTEIERRLRAEDRLIGDYYGYTYRIANPRVQTAYEIFREVFSPRNFRVEGMNHQAMRADYYYHLLAHFHAGAAAARLGRRIKGVVADLNRNNAELLGRICRFADTPDALSDAAVRAITDELSAERIAYDEAMRPRIDALLDRMQDLAAAARRPRSQTRARVANVAAAALLASTLGCGPKPDTHMAEMAPPDPTLQPDETTLSPEQVAQMQEQIQTQYQDALREFANRNGLQGTQQRMEVQIDGSGRVDRVSLIGFQQLDSDLWNMVQQWEFPGIPRRGERLTGLITISFPQDMDTHMAEMAPQDPAPPPPPPQDPPKPPIQLTPNEVANLQAQIQNAHYQEMAKLAKKHAGDLASAQVDIEFGPGGAIAKADVQLAAGDKKHKRFARKLTKLMRRWAFPTYAEGRKATVWVYFGQAVKVEERRDTHMAEMAPRDPTWNQPKQKIDE